MLVTSWRRWATTSARWLWRSHSWSPATTCCCCLSRIASGSKHLAVQNSLSTTPNACSYSCHAGARSLLTLADVDWPCRYDALRGSNRGWAAAAGQGKNQRGGRSIKQRPSQHPATMADLVTHFVRLHGGAVFDCTFVPAALLEPSPPAGLLLYRYLQHCPDLVL
jgi:hypothetical protein